jgi:hypothetical protein
MILRQMIAAIAILSLFAAPASAVRTKKGELSSEQKKQFKASKKVLKKDLQAATRARVDAKQPYLKAKRELALAEASKINGDANLQKARNRVALIRGLQDATGISPVVGGKQVDSAQVARENALVAKAERYHERVVVARYDRAIAAYDSAKTRFDKAGTDLAAVRQNLATRKDQKNAARATNLAAANAAKALKKQKKSGPASQSQYGQLPAFKDAVAGNVGQYGPAPQFAQAHYASVLSGLE